VAVHGAQTDNARRADKKIRDKAISVMTKWISQQRALVGAKSPFALCPFSLLLSKPSLQPQLLVVTHCISARTCVTGASTSDA
jgi:hypothetical protein